MADSCLKCHAPAHFGLNVTHCSNSACEDFSELCPTIPPAAPPPEADSDCCTAFRWAGYEECRACGRVFLAVQRTFAGRLALADALLAHPDVEISAEDLMRTLVG